MTTAVRLRQAARLPKARGLKTRLSRTFLTFIAGPHSLYEALTLVFAELFERVTRDADAFEHVHLVARVARSYRLHDALFRRTQSSTAPA